MTERAPAHNQGWLYRYPYVIGIPLAVAAAVASSFAVGLGIGDADLEAGGRFGVVYFWLPLAFVGSFWLVVAGFVVTLGLVGERGMAVRRGFAWALGVAVVAELSAFALTAAVVRNYGT